MISSEKKFTSLFQLVGSGQVNISFSIAHQACFQRKTQHTKKDVRELYLVRLSLLTMTNPNQLCDVLLFVCSKMADETNLSSKLPIADRTSEV